LNGLGLARFRRILITGGAGFIGSHLAERLVTEGAAVRVLDDLSTGRAENLPKDVELLIADVTDWEAVASAAHRVDAIFHLAAIASVARSINEWPRAHQVNAAGTVTVLDVAARPFAAPGTPVVYASSAAVYGDNPEIPLAETALPRPLSPYAVDKLASEFHAQLATEMRGLPTLGLRFFNIYGPRQDPQSPYSGVISIFADRASRGEPLTIHGDGEQTRDFVHVGDAVQALLCAMRHLRNQPAQGQVFNVCTGRAVTITELAREINVVWRSPATLQYGPPRGGDVRHSLGDPAAAAAVCGFHARISLNEGLAQLAVDTRAGDTLAATRGGERNALWAE
jgi:UDP-glucose 4-epimerase